MPLDAQEEAFVLEYAKDFNATRAAIRAGYSKRSAYNQGYRLMKNDEVQARIREILNELKAPAEAILQRLQQQAFADIGDLVKIETIRFKSGSRKGAIRSQTVTLDLDTAIKNGQSHLIKSIQQTDKGIKVELYDAQDALGLLGKHHRLFDDKVRVEHSVNWQGLSALLDKFYGSPDNSEPPS